MSEPAPDLLDDSYALVGTARDLLRMDDASTAGRWPRISAFLARQGIETAMAALWELVCPGMEEASWRSQFLCLPFLLGDRELGTRAAATWDALTRVCHVRVYAVAPTAVELSGWIETGWALCEGVAGLKRRMTAKA